MTHICVSKLTIIGSDNYFFAIMLKAMLVNKDFQTWHVIGWQHSRHDRKSLLTYLVVNMDFSW